MVSHCGRFNTGQPLGAGPTRQVRCLSVCHSGALLMSGSVNAWLGITAGRLLTAPKISKQISKRQQNDWDVKQGHAKLGVAR
jgi:hypothetical protein